MINAQQNPPGCNFDQLTGTGTHISITQQVLLEEAVIAQIKACCLKAWSKMEEAGTPAQSFSKVIQTLNEPYTDFLARLQKAIRRTVNGEEAQNQLLLSLAFENANDVSIIKGLCKLLKLLEVLLMITSAVVEKLVLTVIMLIFLLML